MFNTIYQRCLKSQFARTFAENGGTIVYIGHVRGISRRIGRDNLEID
jgi:hypothetical protein